MASYIETLFGDRDRITSCLKTLIEQQESTIADLERRRDASMVLLDQHIMRTVLFRAKFGAGATESLSSETSAEEASKPVTDAVRRVERETQIMQVFRDALEKIQSGASLEDLGLAIPAMPDLG
ncbi:MAG: hypothetical protein HW416_977 [Chloroflexi bacterium]|nr:hypothetical protein [Chloroflexota bacterium]